MGVDIYYCENCKECLHSDFMPQCFSCSELSLCDRCYEDSNMFENDGNIFHFCDDCIIRYAGQKLGEINASGEEISIEDEKAFENHKKSHSKYWIKNVNYYQRRIKEEEEELKSIQNDTQNRINKLKKQLEALKTKPDKVDKKK